MCSQEANAATRAASLGQGLAGPLLEHGAVEPLDHAIGLGSVGEMMFASVWIGVIDFRAGIDEVLANSVSYTGATAVLVRATLEGSTLVIEVSDNGRAFNPLAIAPPDVATPVERREAGGLGIHLVRTLMDAVEYTYVGHQNLLTMTGEPHEVGQ